MNLNEGARANASPVSARYHQLPILVSRAQGRPVHWANRRAITVAVSHPVAGWSLCAPAGGPHAKRARSRCESSNQVIY